MYSVPRYIYLADVLWCDVLHHKVLRAVRWLSGYYCRFTSGKTCGLSLVSLYVLLVSVSYGRSGFLPQSNDMQVRCPGNSKSPVGVIVNVFVSLYVLAL